MKNKLIVLGLCIALTMSLVGCSGSGGSYSSDSTMNSMPSYDDSEGWSGLNGSYKGESAVDDYYENGEYEEEPTLPEHLTMQINQEKLVYRADISMEAKEFDSAVAALKQSVSSYGGIIQNENFSDDTPYDYYYDSSSYRKISGYKSFSTTVRIPTEKFNQFMSGLNTIGHIKYSNSQVDNITQQYYNNTAYLESYQNQLEVLQNMYNQTGSISEMLEIEKRIAEVQAEITMLTTEIQSMDMDVAYSTISIRLDEVTEYSETSREESEKSFIVRVVDEFTQSCTDAVDAIKGFILWVVGNFWALIFWIAVIVLIIKLIKHKIRKHRSSGKSSKLDNYIKKHEEMSNAMLQQNIMNRKMNDNKIYTSQEEFEAQQRAEEELEDALNDLESQNYSEDLDNSEETNGTEENKED